MSAVDPVAEPSMEEILSSIRDAINDDAPAASPASPLDGDPFASGSSAEAAFAAPPSGQNFDSKTHRAHDPFSELTRKLNESREQVHQQMQQASTPTRPSEVVPPPPPPAAVTSDTPQIENPETDQRAEFSTIVSNLARRQPVPPPASPDPKQFGATITPASSIPAPAPEPANAAVSGSPTLGDAATPTDSAMLDAVLRQVVEPAVKAWLDENLSRIVQDVVREEVRRVASQLK